MPTIEGMIKAGAHIILTGKGSYADPYVIAGEDIAIKGLLKAGTNTVVTGSGTAADPYVLSANATGLIKAGDHITLTGTGTAKDPYVITSVTVMPPRGTPVNLTLGTGFSTGLNKVPKVTKNPDGSATLAGGIKTTGPFDEGQSKPFCVLPKGFAPAESYVFAAFGTMTQYGHTLCGIDINSDSGTMFLNTPDTPAVDIQISLDGLTYWPVST